MLKLDFHSPIRYRPELKSSAIVNFSLPESKGKRNAISNHTSMLHQPSGLCFDSHHGLDSEFRTGS